MKLIINTTLLTLLMSVCCIHSDVAAQDRSGSLIATEVSSLVNAEPEAAPALFSETQLIDQVEQQYETISTEYFDGSCTTCTSDNSCLTYLCIDQMFSGGWLDQGFTGNPNASGGSNGPQGSNGPLIFNDQANEYMMNQLYLFAGRQVCEDGCSWDLGGRVDLLYGTDYYFIQATGLETRDDNSQHWNSNTGPRNAGTAGLYGLALPQAYAEIYSPWAGGVNVKLGHFYTTMGYESVMAPENFFYSHSYIMQYGEPFTHTGMLASWNSSSCLSWHAGITRGWNTWEQPNGQSSFIGGVDWVSPGEETKLKFTVHTGNEDITGNNNRTAYSLVFQQRLNQCWTYILHHNFGVEQNAKVNTSSQLDTAKWFGLVNYLYYTHNPCLDYGIRFEWFDDRDNARIFGLANDNIVTGGTYYNTTLGANWHPNDWFVVRPEIRWDYSDLDAPGITGAFDGGTSRDQLTLGFDVLMTF
ncbi:MAG: hypothetical protein COA78_35625 [Blastopirellula sp.]|nr:MAG: hypothetical protein COA78_35625 [Blastopirellula sp.]